MDNQNKVLRYRICKRADDITKKDIEKMLPPFQISEYKDLNIVFVNNPESFYTFRIREDVKSVLKYRGISATLQTTNYIPFGEPALVLEFGDISNEVR